MTENKTKQQVFNYTKKDTIVPYVVKKQRYKGRVYLYVYKQFRIGKKVLSIYVGPLDKIVEFYEKHKPKGKRRGRDLNPGAPNGASDLESDPLDLTQAPRPKL